MCVRLRCNSYKCFFELGWDDRYATNFYSNPFGKGKDGKITVTLNVVLVEGITNEYGLNLKINSHDQIKRY